MAKILIEAGADLRAIDDEHKGTAVDWADVSADITNDPKCREVADYLIECGVPRRAE